jgi:hypothetical protein
VTLKPDHPLKPPGNLFKLLGLLPVPSFFNSNMYLLSLVLLRKKKNVSNEKKKTLMIFFLTSKKGSKSKKKLKT